MRLTVGSDAMAVEPSSDDASSVAADLVVAQHKFVLVLVDALDCQRSNMVDLLAEQVLLVVAELLGVELHPTRPSNSNILRQSLLDCWILRCLPFRDVWIYNLSQCDRRHLKKKKNFLIVVNETNFWSN